MRNKRCLLLLFGSSVCLLWLIIARVAWAADEKKVVIPFDFVSKFDNGRYGEMVADMIWKKLERERGFIIPESMQEVRDYCAREKIRPAPDMPLEKMKKIVQEDFGAHVGIWGSVERAAGQEWEIYDLTIKCVDFTVYPDPKVIYECNTRTKSVSEIPHLYVKQMLDALYQRKPGEAPKPDALVEKNWQENPNLLVGGDFQSGSGAAPKGWEPVAGQFREPLGKLVRWLPETSNPQNKVVRFTFPASVGDNEGVMYYSKPFPVEMGATYRFQCRWRSNGPAVKVFIKCYDEIGGQYRPTSAAEGQPNNSGGAGEGDSPISAARKSGQSPARESGQSPATRQGGAEYIPEVGQVREVYRSQQNLKGGKNAWNTQTEDFTPKHTKYTPRWGRVMLYAYIGAGVVEFDDVVVKQIIPASPGEQNNQIRRHSLETKVTLEEMKENERRSREAEEREKAGATRKP